MVDKLETPKPVPSIIAEKVPTDIEQTPISSLVDNTLEAELNAEKKEMDAQKFYNETMNLRPAEEKSTSKEVRDFSGYEKRTYSFLTFVNPKS